MFCNIKTTYIFYYPAQHLQKSVIDLSKRSVNKTVYIDKIAQPMRSVLKKVSHKFNIVCGEE